MTKTENVTRLARSQSSPASIGSVFAHKLSEKGLTKQGEPTEQRELRIRESNLEHLVPSSECVREQKNKKMRNGGVPMERQYGRRGDVGGIPPTLQSGEGSGTTTEQQSQQVSIETVLGGEAMVRGGGSLC